MQHREAFRTDGTRQSIGPFHFRARGVLLVNRTSIDAAFFDDAGNEYDAPAHVAATYPLAIPTTRLSGGTVVATPATDPGSLVATVLDAETILSTAQLQTISLAQTVIQYVGSNFPATAQPDGTVIAYTPDPVGHPGVVWTLRFNATTSWWECLGSSPIFTAIDTDENLGASVGVWIDAPTLGPGFVVPRLGDYFGSYKHGFYNTGVAANMITGVAPGGVTPSSPVTANVAPGVGLEGVIGGFIELTNVAAGTNVLTRYLQFAANCRVIRRTFSLVPIRVK